MTACEDLLLGCLFLLVALLYAAVGQAGASAYLAVMRRVSAIGTLLVHRAGQRRDFAIG